MLQYFKKPSKASGEGSTAASTQPGNTTDPAAQAADTTQAVSEDDSHNAVSGESDEEAPVLSDADQEFLLRVASEGQGDDEEATAPPPLPPRPAWSSPKTDQDPPTGISEGTEGDAVREQSRTADARAWAESWIEWGIRPTQDLAMRKYQELSDARQASIAEKQKASGRRTAADTLKQAADSFKAQQEVKGEDKSEESERESKEMGSILARLDLSSINNRAVGVSKETQRLLESFNQVLKDVVNGGPTAYRDLEQFLTQRQSQLEKLYSGLPPFLQSLVKIVPVKVYAALAPQVAAAMALEQDKAGEKAQDFSDGKKKQSKVRYAIPTLKSLVGQKGAVAAMLRSIIGFLELRFPALLAGTNVIVSLAVFILLFVFWYCHKRGRETRLADAEASTHAAAAAADGKSLADLEKGVGVEQSRSMLAAQRDGPTAEARLSALPEGDDADIERNIDVLMAQLSEPTAPADHR